MVVGWRRAAGVVVTVAGLVGCSSGDSTTSPTPAASLVGPTWRLTTIAGQAILGGTTVTAEFSSDNRVAGKAGCNGYFGSARAEAGQLAVGPLASTMMACAPQAVMDQETRYLATLQSATSFAIDGDALRLGPSAGQTTLVFTSR